MPALQGNDGIGSSKDQGAVDEESDPFVQNLFVLRHGEEAVSSESERPWDPPLTDRGKLQAWRVGRTLRLEDWNITRVVMSPFLRCVQTAAEVIAGLCSLPSSLDQDCTTTRSNAGSGSTLKASIECGLADMMKRQGIAYPPQLPHKNSSLLPWTLDLPQLYSLLPRDIYDPSYQPIRQTFQESLILFEENLLSLKREAQGLFLVSQLPSCRESAADVQCRYDTTLQKIANRFHSEHILCITHGEGVMKSVSMMWPRVEMYGVTHCAYTHAQRPNFKRDDGLNILSGEWELLTESGSSSGVFFSPSR